MTNRQTAFGLLGAATLLAMIACRQPQRMAPGVAQDTLMSLRINMKTPELEATLGRPLEIHQRHADAARGKLFRWMYADTSCRNMAGVRWGCEGWFVNATVHAGEVQTVLVYRNGALVFSCEGTACPAVHNPAAFADLPPRARRSS